MNPRPTFVPDGRLGVPAEIEGRPPPELLAEVLADGLDRLGLG